jgi:uncharacterized membrane-anchored protein
MNTDKDSQIRLATYHENLLIQLRLRDVPGDRIGQILAEVETHVADTGLDPVDAFGEPGEYAATYAATYAAEAATAHHANGWLRGSVLRVAVPSTLAGWAVLEGSMHFASLADITARSLAVLLVLAAGSTAVLHALKAQLARDTAGSLKSRKFTVLSMLLAWVIWLVGVAVLVLIPLLLPPGPTIASVPGWTLVVAGLLAFFAVVLRLGGDRVTDPRE